MTTSMLDFIAPRRDLARLVDACKGACDPKGTMVALGNVLLDARHLGELRITGTDLYLSTSGTIPADVASTGFVSIPAKDLAERLHNMPEGPVQIIASESAATTIKAVGHPRRYTVHGLPGTEFPRVAECSPDAPTFDLAVDVIARLIRRTWQTISTDETRPHVNSALFTWKGGVARMVATDGHRLAITTEAAPFPAAAKPVKRGAPPPAPTASADPSLEVLLPLDTVKELRRLCDAALATKSEAGPRVKIRQHGATMFFELAGYTFSAKTVDAQFPPYEQATPQPSLHRARLGRLALIEAIDAVAVAADGKTGGVKLHVAPGRLRLTSTASDSGDGADELAADYDGPEVTTGANATYLRHALDAIDDEEVLLDLAGELDPIRIEGATPGNASAFLAVVMPMRVS